MSNTQRLEAKGPRGEACIIVRAMSGGQPTYCLGSGDRLASTDDPAVFQTIDGKRRFTLRSEATSTSISAPILATQGPLPVDIEQRESAAG